MSNIDTLKRMQDLIDMVLDECDKYDYPHVCNMASDPETRPVIEKKILDVVKRSGISVQEAIDHIERTYNPNMIED